MALRVNVPNAPNLSIIFSTYKDGTFDKYTSTQVAGESARRKRFIEKEVGPGEVSWLKAQLGPLSRATKNIVGGSGLWLKKGERGTLLSADCIPLILYNSNTEKVLLLHVGWKELALGVTSGGINKFFTEVLPQETHIVLGPAVCGECYASNSWRWKVKTFLFKLAHLGKAVSYTDTIHIDLKQAVLVLLDKRGVRPTQITDTVFCTCHDKDLFPSRTREGRAQRYAMLTLVEVNKTP